jgi:hypothetical protein
MQKRLGFAATLPQDVFDVATGYPSAFEPTKVLVPPF